MTKILLGAALPALLALGTIHSATAQTVSRIVFQAPVTVNRQGTYSQIFSMNPDGSGVVQLTSANASACGPRWSPGQQYIAFSRNQTLYVMEAKGEAHGGRTFAVAPAALGGADWSPDGTMLVYEGPNGNLYIVPVDVVNRKAGTPVLFRSGKYSDPSWSPDGTRIAFWGCDDGNLPFFIKVRDVATGAEISFGVFDPAAAAGFSNETPQWSPDGKFIAFSGPVTWTVTTKKGASTSTAEEIFIANADGTGNPQRVTYLKSYTIYPTWSPDGTTIAFRSDVSGTPSVYKMVLGSNGATLLHSLANEPDWNP
jgi:Tol biopolymer transport system component